jgi:hypothetical protein
MTNGRPRECGESASEYQAYRVYRGLQPYPGRGMARLSADFDPTSEIARPTPATECGHAASLRAVGHIVKPREMG